MLGHLWRSSAVFRTLDFDAVFAAAPAVAGKTVLFAGQHVDILTTLCLLLFVGAMGKSAQLGLHTWLPDAMEGPTPVSALIHAATMVTAGVFLVCRCSPLFEHAPHGARHSSPSSAPSTAFFAASVGLFQNDIKRVIAYSTCSQLGYMFAAAGVSAYGAAMFHLFTHAFFKALLFLAAGSVITAMHHEQDMRKMGGLAQGHSLHLGDDADRQSGADRLRHSLSRHRHGGLLFQGRHHQRRLSRRARRSAPTPSALTAIAALMTSFYSWRQFLMTFHGKYRGGEGHDGHAVKLEDVHESPLTMLVPLGVLAAGAVVAGAIFAHLYIGADARRILARRGCGGLRPCGRARSAAVGGAGAVRQHC